MSASSPTYLNIINFATSEFVELTQAPLTPTKPASTAAAARAADTPPSPHPHGKRSRELSSSDILHLDLSPGEEEPSASPPKRLRIEDEEDDSDVEDFSRYCDECGERFPPGMLERRTCHCDLCEHTCDECVLAEDGSHFDTGFSIHCFLCAEEIPVDVFAKRTCQCHACKTLCTQCLAVSDTIHSDCTEQVDEEDDDHLTVESEGAYHRCDRCHAKVLDEEREKCPCAICFKRLCPKCAPAAHDEQNHVDAIVVE